MIQLVLCVGLGLALCAATASGEPLATKIDIVRDGIGIPPHDFEFWQTGGGPNGQWAVVRDPTTVAGAAIEQSSMDRKEGRLPLAIYRPNSLKNVAVSTRFKLIQGAMQSAGIAVRVINAGSYYVAVANALEERVDLFRFLNGIRVRITGIEADVQRGHWQTLKLVIDENHFTVSLDGNLLFDAWDNGYLEDGYVALWTEEDNVTRFEEIIITPLTYTE
jgi:hypothetical protein